MQNYLFVHFRETTSPEGEQVHFAVSRDGFHWQALNDGKPVLWAYYGDHGVRDMTVIRDKKTGKFHIFATDLSLSFGMRGKYSHSWHNCCTKGSKDLGHWVSDDLVHWSEEEMVTLGDGDCGCVWAPDVIYDKEQDDYVLHWSCCHKSNGFGPMGIYYNRTKDFIHYTAPQCLYRKEEGMGGCIDSAMYEEDGKYYLFVKSDKTPNRVMLLKGDHVNGPFTVVENFSQSMLSVQEGVYEAPTAVKMDDGRWALFIDYYGVQGAGQGYVPFLSSKLSEGRFARSDESFSFPYGFKHGTILTITEEECDRMLAHNWQNVPDGRWG